MQQEMTLKEAMYARHSVRSYKPDAISAEDVEKLNGFIAECNAESGLHMQLVTDCKEAFNTFLNHYGWFKNAHSYIALVGKDDKELDEKCGYYGEKLVLFAQQIGLGTCWVGGTFSRKKTDYEAAEGEKLCLVILIGYPENNGKEHKNKPLSKLCNLTDNSPEWFKNGMQAALTAPTAVNQQKFRFELQPDGRVRATGGGSFGQVDLGIAKYHFEIGSGKGHDIWC